MVFGTMRVGKKPILLILEDENHTSRKYIKYLKKTWELMKADPDRGSKYLDSDQNWIWQQDGAASMSFFY